MGRPEFDIYVPQGVSTVKYEFQEELRILHIWPADEPEFSEQDPYVVTEGTKIFPWMADEGWHIKGFFDNRKGTLTGIGDDGCILGRYDRTAEYPYKVEIRFKGTCGGITAAYPPPKPEAQPKTYTRENPYIPQSYRDVDERFTGWWARSVGGSDWTGKITRIHNEEVWGYWDIDPREKWVTSRTIAALWNTETPEAPQATDDGFCPQETSLNESHVGRWGKTRKGVIVRIELNGNKYSKERFPFKYVNDFPTINSRGFAWNDEKTPYAWDLVYVFPSTYQPEAEKPAEEAPQAPPLSERPRAYPKLDIDLPLRDIQDRIRQLFIDKRKIEAQIDVLRSLESEYRRKYN